MNNVVAAIFVGLILIILIFVGIGGSFDRHFWLSFLPGLMENLAVLAVAVLVIESIFKSERLSKLQQTNERQSRFVLFLSNRLAYHLLEHLALATKDEFHKDAELNFEFARDRFKVTNLPKIFYDKLMESKTKEAFTEGFEKILSNGTESISKALDNIYPRPDPTIKQNVDEINFSIGAVGSLKMLIASFKAANEQVGADKQMTPEQLNLLIEIAYSQIGLEIQKTQNAIVQLSEQANANELFISFD
jgi:hypothetical protein